MASCGYKQIWIQSKIESWHCHIAQLECGSAFPYVKQIWEEYKLADWFKGNAGAVLGVKFCPGSQCHLISIK